MMVMKVAQANGSMSLALRCGEAAMGSIACCQIRCHGDEDRTACAGSVVSVAPILEGHSPERDQVIGRFMLLSQCWVQI